MLVHRLFHLKKDVLDFRWFVVENKCCSELMIDSHWMDKRLKEVLMIDWLGIVETDKVNPIVETDIVKLMVEIMSFGMSFNDFNKETGSSDGLQPKQADLSCVHALSKLYLHEFHVVLTIGFDCLLALDEEIYPRIVHEKVDKEGNTIHKLPNQIETNELFNHLRPCELVIRENIYSAIGNRDHTQVVIALMLYCLETRQSFNLAYIIIRRMYFFRDQKDKFLPYGMILTHLFRNLKANMAEHLFDKRYKLVLGKMSSLKARQPKKPPPKITRNVGKSKRAQLSTSSLTESPPSDNEDFPSIKLSPMSYSRAFKDDPSMSKEQTKTRGMFKNMGRALHNFARMLKKGCR
nr:hypothetical protein [Tanacetum cinerariifolium]